MVEHESVDPKAQGKPGLVTGVTQARVWGAELVEEVVGRRVYAAEGIGGEATRGGGARRRSRSPVSGLGTSGEGEEGGDPLFADNRPRPVLWGLVGGCALLSQWVDREVLPVRVGGVALLNLARLPYSRVDQASHPFIVSVSPRRLLKRP